ncbi:polyphosphate kinase 2 [Gordonia amicalis]|uniref:Polyphosphate kinase 2 n=1 Tax=Gordonia amicalis TaxID=89053 RepID=A0ABU4DJZ7_9ACTN|nr:MULTISPECIES: polyphosphate kinase 2 [Gordonia]ATD70325.1 polyphosphate kinase 2 [Gordonia sp. 1D]MDV6310065.1 polyphosphate kinase 2 [Gordonia amicalis]MDV7101895.1 polyphosphate kinase 2 [Gordonia amicalis]MDV7173413.1 polyphosphate kinase 2 [Gordonia amicalis]UKO93892.1 polyphosphate kinase 2 [Gordonia amicalis]
MGGKKHRGKNSGSGLSGVAAADQPGCGRPGGTAAHPMSDKAYRKALKPLHAELVAMQEWVRSSGAKVCVVFEGRDTAIFDRSWYNRAGIERVLGYCTEEQARQFLEQTPTVERAMVDSGIILLKYWLEVSQEQQTLRLQSRIDDPRKIWKLSKADLESYSRWYDFSRARDEMFRYTDTGWAPWYVVSNDDKKRGRLNVISHLLGQVPYDPLELPDVTLPKRQKPHGYRHTDQALHWIPTPYQER